MSVCLLALALGPGKNGRRGAARQKRQWIGPAIDLVLIPAKRSVQRPLARLLIATEKKPCRRVTAVPSDEAARCRRTSGDADKIDLERSPMESSVAAVETSGSLQACDEVSHKATQLSAIESRPKSFSPLPVASAWTPSMSLANPRRLGSMPSRDDSAS